MKSTKGKPFRILAFFYRSLLVCLVALGLVFIAGTIYGIFFQAVPPENNLQVKVLQEIEKGQTFTGIGRIRVSTADPQPGMVILFVSFLYYPEDKAFAEELALRIRDFRYIIIDYIGSLSTAELNELSEEMLKAELLYRFNSVLRLGQIKTLFFSDFMVVQ